MAYDPNASGLCRTLCDHSDAGCALSGGRGEDECPINVRVFELVVEDAS